MSHSDRVAGRGGRLERQRRAAARGPGQSPEARCCFRVRPFSILWMVSLLVPISRPRSAPVRPFFCRAFRMISPVVLPAFGIVRDDLLGKVRVNEIGFVLPKEVLALRA